MDNIKDRLRRARMEIGASVEEIAKELLEKNIKISARTIYSYELNERQPSILYIKALVELYNINPSWLLGQSSNIFSDEKLSNNKICENLNNMVFIPLLNISASAGYGELIQEKEATKDFIAFSKKWLNNITVTSPEHLMLFTIVGDSMEGEFSNGDLVLINDTLNDLSKDGIYVVCIDDKLYIKILQRIPGNKVQILSKNTKYAPYTIDLNTEYFKIIGKVIWSGCKNSF